MNWRQEDIPSIPLVADILTIMKVPTSQREMRKRVGLSAWSAKILIDKLVKCAALKLYAQDAGKQEDDETRTLIITPKGHEFLRRYKNLLKALGLDPEDPKALDSMPYKRG